MGFSPTALGVEDVSRGAYVRLERVTFDAEGTEFTRDVVRHPGAVAICAFDGTNVFFIRQWRAPLDRAILELPAGTRDVADEDPAETARRELEEEVGLAAGSIEPLCATWNSPGWCDQETIVFLATDLTEVERRPNGIEEEAIEVVTLSMDEAVAWLDAGETIDATTVLAIRTLAQRLGR
jgi:8-oxo-dGTP pyrophosphatase MutT (NUDIX family)